MYKPGAFFNLGWEGVDADFGIIFNANVVKVL